jgi:zinc D-Ala-D-Ala carboxypeptidase
MRKQEGQLGKMRLETTRKPALLIGILAATVAFSGCSNKGPASTAGPEPSGSPLGAATLAPTPTAGASVPVKDATGLAVVPGELVLAPGTTQSLSVQATLKQGKQDITRADGVSYSSSAPELVTVGGDGSLSAAKTAPSGSVAWVKVSYQGQTKEVLVKVMATLEATVKAGPSGLPVVTNPADRAVVVNKKRSLASDYAPTDLVYPDVPFTFNDKIEKRMMRSEAAKALEKLFAQATKDNIKLAGVSAYRSYATQKSVYMSNVRTQGEKEAARVSAQPGLSEHQTGLAIDVSSPSVKYDLEATFGESKEGKWLAEHAPEFGFIIRYLKDKESITGYTYEPWHIRYVGVDMAKEISASGLTLEEYFQSATAVNAKK